MFVFYEQATGRSSTLPPFQITETPNPACSDALRERGNHVFGANPPLSGGGAGSLRASPTANPVGRRRRSVCFRTLKKLKAGLAAVTAVAALAIVVPAGASANCGGGGVTPAEVDICTPTPKAQLLSNGMLIPPKAAPPRVKAVIAAANRIRTKPYIYGGGHASWWDRGYDCSGSVSYALHGGEFLESPLPSGPMESWGVSRRRSLDHRLGQRRPRLRRNRRLPLGHRRRRERHRAALARRTARQRRLRRPPPARLLADHARRAAPWRSRTYSAPANRPGRICPCFPDPLG